MQVLFVNVFCSPWHPVSQTYVTNLNSESESSFYLMTFKNITAVIDTIVIYNKFKDREQVHNS